MPTAVPWRGSQNETGDDPGRRKPNEETDGASSPTRACPCSAQKLTRKRKGGSSAKTRERNTATRTRSKGGGALHERAQTKKSTAVAHDSRRRQRPAVCFTES
jgi:hypothetical protein